MATRTVVTLAHSERSDSPDAIVVDGWAFIGGQVAIDPVTGKAFQGSFEDEVLLVLNRIEKILETAGMVVEDIATCTCYISSITDSGALDSAFRRTFDEPYPARTLLTAQIDGGFRICIDATAHKGHRARQICD